MKYKLTLLFLLFSATLILAKPIKVACVGNSITYGYTLEKRELESKSPSQLQRMLGNKYNVGNFENPERHSSIKDIVRICNKRIMLNPLKTGIPYTLSISSSNLKLTYTDVVAGEVWLCSGQSNMEFQLSRSYKAKSDIQSANNSDIRLFDMKAHWLTTYEPGYLFEASIRPLAQYSKAGAIWYQGESNAHNKDAHAKLFKLLINSWRENWKNPELPFYYVQLSSLDRPSWTWFRDSQRRLQNEISFTGMAVSSDLGDSLDVHPKHKKKIGERLAKLALNKTYHFDNILPSGPLLKNVGFEKSKAYISFSYGKILKTSDGKPL